MSTTQQPEALRLADCLEGNATTPWTREEAATELRRMYAKNQSLQSEATENARIIGASAETELALRARIAELEAQLSAIGAGGVEPLRKQASTADVADERDAFEKWLRIKPCGAAHDFGWEAWKARAAMASNKKG